MLKPTDLKVKRALAGMAQWIEHWPVNQRVAGSNSNRHMPGLRAEFSVRGAQEATTRLCFSLFLPSFLSV